MTLYVDTRDCACVYVKAKATILETQLDVDMRKERELR
jgi:hypothetical protein